MVDSLYPAVHIWAVTEIITTNIFDEWLDALKDRKGRARIRARIDRLALGNPGDVKPVGGGISEMRIDFGPGYRVYFMQRGQVLVIILAGGDKSSQPRDIITAQQLAALARDRFNLTQIET